MRNCFFPKNEVHQRLDKWEDLLVREKVPSELRKWDQEEEVGCVTSCTGWHSWRFWWRWNSNSLLGSAFCSLGMEGTSQKDSFHGFERRYATCDSNLASSLFHPSLHKWTKYSDVILETRFNLHSFQTLWFCIPRSHQNPKIRKIMHLVHGIFRASSNEFSSESPPLIWVIFSRDGRPTPRCGEGGFPAPPRPVKIIKTAGKLLDKVKAWISTFSNRGNQWWNNITTLNIPNPACQ